MGKEYSSIMYVVTHKRIDKPVCAKGYCYIGVGKNSTNAQVSDNVGENISDKNPNYCELTALYWIWKNSDAKYLGLCHYRRFFVKNENSAFYLCDTNELNEILKFNDIIAPEPIVFPCDYVKY